MDIHNQNETLDFGEDPVTSVSKEDVPVPQERVGQAEVKGDADTATEPSTSEVTNSKIPAFQLSDEGKHFMEPKIPKEDLQSQLLDLGEEIQGAEASTSCNELPEILEEEPQIDDSVIKHMKRLTPIFDAKSGIVIGEIHAQYLPFESDEDDRTAKNTAETQTSGTNSSAEEPKGSQSSNVAGSSKTIMKDGNIPSCSTENRTKNIFGLEVIDTEITLLSTEIIGSPTHEPESESAVHVENDYFTRHPLMRLFLCGACCCAKKEKTKRTEKVGLCQRIRKFFRRN